jgi:hypothetical protein
MRLQLIKLDERTGVKEEIDSFTCRQLAGIMLTFDTFFATAKFGLFVEFLQSFDVVFHNTLRSGKLELITMVQRTT